MSATAINRDQSCRSLGFVNNPPRGYFRSLKTCHADNPASATTPVADTNPCSIIAKAFVRHVEGSSPRAVEYAQFGFTSITSTTLGTVTLTLDSPAVPGANHRMLIATPLDPLAYSGAAPPSIGARFLDANQTQIEVITKDRTPDFVDVGFTLEVCECENIIIVA